MSERAWFSQQLGLGPLWQLRQALPATATEFAAEVTAISPEPEPAKSPVSGMNWEQLTQTIKDCRACGLCETRTQAVPGVGAHAADWLVVGEAPGRDEDLQGEPFVGKAGKLLDNMLAALYLRRGETVYIANVIKCRPPNNRDPQAEEIAACRAYLDRQIELVAPKIILAVGRHAAQTLLQSEAAVSKLRGKIHRLGNIPLVVTYHPAYLLRSRGEKARAWQDLLLAQTAVSRT